MNPSYSDLLDISWAQLKDKLPLSVALAAVFLLATAATNMIPVLGWVLVVPISVGYLRCVLSLRKGEDFGWEDFCWVFLDFNRFLHSCLLNILLVIGSTIGFILLIIPGIWFTVASTLSWQAFVMDKPDAVGNIKSSMEMVKGRWWWMCGVLLILALLNLIGALCFVIGLLFTVPLSVLILVNVYEQLSSSRVVEAKIVPPPVQ